MVRYTVVWAKGAQDELAEIWLAAQDADAVTRASHAVDRALADEAMAKGVKLSEGLRALYAPPLRVLFAVREEDRIAEVLRVRWA